MWIGHRKEIRKLTFRALALRRSGFENHNGWLQAFPSFPSPIPSFSFLLSPQFSRGQNAEHPVSSLFAPRKRLLRRLTAH